MRKTIIRFLAKLLNVEIESMVKPYERPIIIKEIKPIKIKSVGKFEDFIPHDIILIELSKGIIKNILAKKLYTLTNIEESYRTIDKFNTYEFEVNIIPPFKNNIIKN